MWLGPMPVGGDWENPDGRRAGAADAFLDELAGVLERARVETAAHNRMNHVMVVRHRLH